MKDRLTDPDCRTCEQDFTFHVYEFIEHCVYQNISQKKVLNMINDVIPKMYKEIKNES